MSWQDFQAGFFRELGGKVARLFFCPTGFVVACSALGIGILVYAHDVKNSESKAQVTVENICRIEWDYFYHYRRMKNKSQFMYADEKYIYKLVKFSSYSNVAVIVSQPKNFDSQKKDNSSQQFFQLVIPRKSFVGIAFGPGGAQRNYACRICKSKTTSTTNTSPVVTRSGVDCPSGYEFVNNLSR